MLSEFNAEAIEYLIVGAYAMAAHSCPRATRDIDFWVRPSPENARRVFVALARFGALMASVTIEDFEKPGTIFQVGVPPLRVDVITVIDGVEFADAWPNRIVVELAGIPANVIGRDELLRNKRSTGRPKDSLDVTLLENQIAREQGR